MNEIELRKSPVVFMEDEHRYFLGDKELQGITSTLIHRAFPDKYKDIDPETLAKAAEKGHQLHTAIELFDNFGGNPANAQDERIQLYADLMLREGFTKLANEYIVSDEEHYASAIDAVKLNNLKEICLFDFKSTWNLDKASTGLQLSIYKRFFERQNPGLKVAHIYVLWLPNKDHTICQLHELSVVDEETINELIDADLNNKPFTFQKIPDEWQALEFKYRFLLTQKDNVERMLNEVKARMMEIMVSGNYQTIKTDAFTVSYIAEKTSQKFDAKLFKQENEEMYGKYMKDSVTAAQIRVTPKKEKS